MNRIHTLLYLYFDAQQYKTKSRIVDLTNRLLRSPHPITYSELSELLQLVAKLETLEKVEKDLYDLIRI